MLKWNQLKARTRHKTQWIRCKNVRTEKKIARWSEATEKQKTMRKLQQACFMRTNTKKKNHDTIGRVDFKYERRRWKYAQVQST